MSMNARKIDRAEYLKLRTDGAVTRDTLAIP